MKTNTVIANTKGERIVTSTTETMQIKARDLQPCDWIMKHHHRSLRHDKRVLRVQVAGSMVTVATQLHGIVMFNVDQLIDVERVTCRK